MIKFGDGTDWKWVGALDVIEFTVDDAYITYRYVDNFLQAEGLVYNAGERVLGSSAPLYLLILCAFGLLGLDYILFGKLLCLLGGCLACCLLFLLLEKQEGKRTALLAALFLALGSNHVVWTVSGLETGLSVFLSLASIWLYGKDQQTAAGIVLGLAILTRIDALLLVYDATTGPLQTAVEIVKKVLHINGCPLCDTTHGPRHEKAEWRSCREALGVPMRYFHKDGLTADVERVVDGRVPCILAQVDGELVRLLEPSVIHRCRGSVRNLRGKISYHAARKGLSLS